jgi:hypothetical protein
MADDDEAFPLTAAVTAMEPIENVSQLSNAFGVIIGVPEMELKILEIDWTELPIAERDGAKDGMQKAINKLKDQGMAQAEAIRNYIEQLREDGALTGDTTVSIN